MVQLGLEPKEREASGAVTHPHVPLTHLFLLFLSARRFCYPTALIRAAGPSPQGAALCSTAEGPVQCGVGVGGCECGLEDRLPRACTPALALF